MATNLAEVYKNTAETYGNKPGYWSKNEKKEYISTTFGEMSEQGIALANALIDLGLKAREHVGVLADNRLEWAIVDCGILSTGAANVPRGTDITDAEMVHILNHSGAKIVFLENDKLYEKFKKNKSEIKGVKTVILMDKNTKLKSGDEIVFLSDLIEKGREIQNKGKSKVAERIEDIQPDDLFTLIYTSGTTGAPKGVMLTHGNMMHQINYVTPTVANVTPDDRMLSILPIWHIFERVMLYFSLVKGGQTFYTKVTDMRNDIVKCAPTFMASAPRVWESIYNGIYSRVNDPKQTPALRRNLFNIAYFYSKHFHAAVRFLKGNLVDYEGRNILQSSGHFVKSIFQLAFTVPGVLTVACFGLGASLHPTDSDPFEAKILPYLLYAIGALSIVLNYFVLDRLVLSNIRKATGGKLRATLSGGGALQSHVDAFFNDIGISVLEGYGMTETAPVISVRTFERPLMGSVGPVVAKTEVQIRNDKGDILTHINSDGKLVSGKLGVKGVIHVRGPQVMKGYYKNPEATEKVLQNGWMNTGDIGMVNFKMTLTLTGRAKDTIVLLGGENVEPVPIENKLEESPYIKQAMVVGQDQKVLGAIVVPDMEVLTAWAKENGIQELEPTKLAENPKVIEFYKKEVRNYNSTKTGFKSFEQVQPVAVILKPFEVGDELTNLMKMKRHIITEKYESRIKSMFKSY